MLCPLLVVLPKQSLLSPAAQLEVRSRPSCTDITTGFSPIENGGCTRREAWAGGAWRSGFETAVARMLAQYELLPTAFDGPCGGAPKTVARSAALRSLPGCRRQPPHADFSRQLSYAAHPDTPPSIPAPSDTPLPQPGGPTQLMPTPVAETVEEMWRHLNAAVTTSVAAGVAAPVQEVATRVIEDDTDERSATVEVR